MVTAEQAEKNISAAKAAIEQHRINVADLQAQAADLKRAIAGAWSDPSKALDLSGNLARLEVLIGASDRVLEQLEVDKRAAEIDLLEVRINDLAANCKANIDRRYQVEREYTELQAALEQKRAEYNEVSSWVSSTVNAIESEVGAAIRIGADGYTLEEITRPHGYTIRWTAVNR